MVVVMMMMRVRHPNNVLLNNDNALRHENRALFIIPVYL